MEIKRIENLSKEECREFLYNNPNGELSVKVQEQLSSILAEEEKVSQRNEAKRESIVELTFKNNWIDINQFLERRKYINLRGVLLFILLLIAVCSSFLFATLYYTNSIHCIYSEWGHEQANYVFGLENILLDLDFIQPRYYYDSSNLPIWDNYREGGSFFAFLFIGAVLLFSLFITNLKHSSLIGKIHNIGDGTKANKYRPIQNEQGKCGLCRLGWARLIKMLPFQYDLVCPAKDNSFICSKDSKFGLYNAAIKKMVVPVIYDEVYSIDDNISFKKDGSIHTFSYKGYRIME